MTQGAPIRDTEAKATERFMRGGFGKLGSKTTYKRYSKYIDWLRAKLGQPVIKPKGPYFKIEDYFERRAVPLKNKENK